jgi:hypothetical protein
MASVLDYVDELVEGVGPRLAGSDNEFQASKLIASRFEEFGLSVQVEEFNIYPFTQWMPLLAYLLVVFGALFSYFIEAARIAGLILSILGAVIFVLELLGVNPIHRVLPGKISQNVVARYIPTGSISGAPNPRKVVVFANYDTGRAVIEAAPFLAKRAKFLHYFLRVAIGIEVLASVLLVISVLPDMVHVVARYAMIVAAVVVAVALLIGCINQFRPVQRGANCNASGVATLVDLAEMLVAQGAQSSISSAAGAMTSRSRSRRRAASFDEGAPASVGFTVAMDDAGAGTAGSAEGAGAAGGVGAVAGAVGAGAGAGAASVAAAAAAVALGADAASATDAANGDGTSAEFVAAAGASTQNAGQLGRIDASASLDSTLSGTGRSPLSVAENLVQVGTERRNPFVSERQPNDAVQPVQESRLGFGYEPDIAEEPAEEPSNLPAWFVNARKNAEKKNEQRARREGESEVVRSRYADIPMSADEITASSTASRNGSARAGANAGVSTFDISLTDSESVSDSEGNAGVSSATGATNVAASVSSAGVAGAFDARVDTNAVSAAGDVSGTISMPTISSTTEDTDPMQFAEILAATEQEFSADSTNAIAAAGETTPTVRSRGPLPEPDMSGIDRMATTVLPTNNSDSPLIVPTLPENTAETAAATRAAAALEASAQAAAEASPVPSFLNSQDKTPAVSSASILSPVPITTDAVDNIRESDALGVDAVNAAFDDAFNTDPAQIQLPLVELKPVSAETESSTSRTADETSSTDSKDSSASRLSRLQALPEVQSRRRVGALPQVEPVPAAPTQSQTAADPDDVSTQGANQASANTQAASEASVSQTTPATSTASASLASLPSRSARANQQPADDEEIRSFLGSVGSRFVRNRNQSDLSDSPTNWLGVDDSFEARKEGGAIGSWDNFNDDDDDSWRGGAFGGDSFEDDARSIEELSSELLDKEVWLVALGASELNQTGVRYFFNRHERQLRGSLLINLLGVGAGDLCFTLLEGEMPSRRTDQRLQNLLAQAAQEIAVPLAPVAFTAFNTDGSVILGKSSRAISLIGMGNGVPMHWRNKDDSVSLLREDKIKTASHLVLETIKNS